MPAPQRAPAPRFVPKSQPVPAASMPQPKPKVRAVSAEQPAPAARLALPSPEQLGIRTATATAPAAVDWNQLHARLDRLGVVNYQRDRLPQGGVRVVFTLPAAAGQPARPVEATGTTEAAAVLQALQGAESRLVASRAP